jgi:hypothetical protein
MKTSLAFFTILTALLTATAARAEYTAAPASLNGRWVLDAGLSDDPATLLPQQRGGGQGGAMGRGGGGRGGGRGGGAMDRPNGDAPKRGGGLPPGLAEGRRSLVIFTEAEEFVVTDANDIVRLIYLDGRENETWTPRGKVLETARVMDGAVVVVSQDERSGGRTSRYAYDPESGRLTVQIDFRPPGAEQDVTLRSVYVRATD